MLYDTLCVLCMMMYDAVWYCMCPEVVLHLSSLPTLLALSLAVLVLQTNHIVIAISAVSKPIIY